MDGRFTSDLAVAYILDTGPVVKCMDEATCKWELQHQAAHTTHK